MCRRPLNILQLTFLAVLILVVAHWPLSAIYIVGEIAPLFLLLEEVVAGAEAVVLSPLIASKVLAAVGLVWEVAVAKGCAVEIRGRRRGRGEGGN
jgi:hypothetical protein